MSANITVRETQNGELTIIDLFISDIKLPDNPEIAQLVASNNNSVLPKKLFKTSNEYLNNLIQCKELTDNYTRIERSVYIGKTRLNIELAPHYVRVSMVWPGITVKYKCITKSFLRHIATRGAPVLWNTNECCSEHRGIKIRFRYHTCVYVIRHVTIGSFTIETVKFGDTIDNMVAKYTSIIAAIYDNYIEPIGLSNMEDHHMDMVEQMFDAESLSTLKSARSQ